MSSSHIERDEEQRPLLSQQPTSYSASSTAQPTPEPELLNNPSTPEFVLIIIALFSTVFLGVLDSSIIAALLTTISSDFNQAQQASYLGTAYLLTMCCCTPIYGKVSDIIGRRGGMLLALTLFGSGTFLCGLAPSMNTLIAARGLAGMGGGGLYIVATVTITDLVPLRKRGLYQAIGQVAAGAGAGLGGPLGGFINDRWGWRWAFLCQMPILLVCFVLITIYVNVKLPEKPQTFREKLARIDYLGSITLFLGVGGLLLGLTLEGTEDLPWGSPLIIGLLLASVVFLVAFVLVEGFVSKEPVIPIRILRQRTPLATSLAYLTVQGTGYAWIFNLPIYYTAVRLDSARTAGLHLLPLFASLSLGAILVGLIMKATGKYYILLLVSASLVVLGSALITTWTSDSTSELRLWMDPLLFGFGAAGVSTALLIATISSVDSEDSAVATGMAYLFRMTGQVLGVSVTSGVLLQSILVKELHKRITGPGSAELIDKIRHSTAIIRHLDPSSRKAAVESYGSALHVVFMATTAVSVIGLLACAVVQENSLPGTMVEQAKRDEELRQEHGD